MRHSPLQESILADIVVSKLNFYYRQGKCDFPLCLIVESTFYILSYHNRCQHFCGRNSCSLFP